MPVSLLDGGEGLNILTGNTSGGGSIGPAGATGPAGLNGSNGATGPAGLNGGTGATGPSGLNGPTGATGPAGSNGATGATGPAGSNGATGATGPAGPIPNSPPIFGSIQVATDIVIDNMNAIPSTAKTILTFTLPSAGTWDVTYIMRAQDSNGEQFAGEFGLWDDRGIQIQNSAILACYLNTATEPTHGAASGTGRYFITTSGVATYTVRAWASTGTYKIYGTTDTNGLSSVSWVQVTGGYIGATGPAGATGSVGATGPAPTLRSLNYAQTYSSSPINNPALNTSIISTTITTTGAPVQIIVTGDANPDICGAWCRLQLFRGDTAIGGIVQTESTSRNENVPYCLQFIDTPAAGTYTYSMRMITKVTGGTFNFGEATGPVITVVELQTITGSAGVGITTSTTQNGITFGAITTPPVPSVAPTLGTISTSKIIYCRVGDRYKLSYRLGAAAGSTGTGDYLISLPTGLSFNTSLNPIFTSVFNSNPSSQSMWPATVPSMAQYMIPASGNIILSSNQSTPSIGNVVDIFIIPYSAIQFRIMFYINTYGVWSSTYFPLTFNTLLNIDFEIFA
jgi:hypothetical protein